jgi:hypothetical protein
VYHNHDLFILCAIGAVVGLIGGVSAALVLVYGTFHLNRKYGEHGLMKAQARRNHPRYVINRRNFPRLFIHNKRNE